MYEDMELKTTIVDVTGMGDVAAVWYAIVLRVQRKGQEATESRGRGIVTFKRTPEGWKMHWDIWNHPSPPKQGSA
jgi:ketosteroid isomerase-like protein